MFLRIGLALAFSPTCKALMAEAVRLKNFYHSELIIIHIGIKNSEKETFLDSLLAKWDLKGNDVTIIWKQGDPAKNIVKICKKENVDLLVSGALKHESLINYYIGSIARKILRKAPCSVLVLIKPSENPKKIRDIVIDAEDTPVKSRVINDGLIIAKTEKTRVVHMVREIKLYGLAMSILSENSADEHSELKKKLIAQELKKVEKFLEDYDTSDLKINIKIIAGKSGYELRKFTKHVYADLLITGVVNKRMHFIDRLFQHNIEYIFEDIPCNLLVIKSKPSLEK